MIGYDLQERWAREAREQERAFLQAEKERTGIARGVLVRRKRGKQTTGIVERTYVRPKRAGVGDQATADVAWTNGRHRLNGNRVTRSAVRFDDLIVVEGGSTELGN